MTWPDIAIIGILAIGAVKGWKRGFVAEIGGAIAIALAGWAALHYNGAFDAFAATFTHAGPGSAHVVGMIVFAIAVYVALLIISLALSRVARLPVIGVGNNAGGTVIGIAKAAVFVWAVLYVALLFPLSSDVRADLEHSTLVHVETQPNKQIDDAIVSTLPWFARPFVGGFLKGHRV